MGNDFTVGDGNFNSAYANFLGKNNFVPMVIPSFLMVIILIVIVIKTYFFCANHLGNNNVGSYK